MRRPVMQSQSLTCQQGFVAACKASLSRATASATASVWPAVVAWWHAVAARHACNRTATELSHFDDHLLQDIGVPPCIRRAVEIAQETRRLQHQHWLRV
ncbi:hypothetical protein CAL18_11660 [Bordetella genomosp. 7]|nr:hypothetical protein CAL18_11660 [Bordetella genomosp. 7]